MFIQDAITPRETKDTFTENLQSQNGDSAADIPGKSDEMIGNDNSPMVTTFFIYLFIIVESLQIFSLFFSKNLEVT